MAYMRQALETTVYSKNLSLNLAFETSIIRRINTNCDSVFVWDFHFRPTIH